MLIIKSAFRLRAGLNISTGSDAAQPPPSSNVKKIDPPSSQAPATTDTKGTETPNAGKQELDKGPSNQDSGNDAISKVQNQASTEGAGSQKTEKQNDKSQSSNESTGANVASDVDRSKQSAGVRIHERY